jgi:hypothetical protein
MFKSTYREYQGYYYKSDGNIYAGKKFDINAPVLIEINSNSVNSLLTNPSTYVYGAVSGVVLNNQEPSSYYFNTDTTNNVDRYFISKFNNNIIKEINQDTYNQFKNDPLYASVSLYYQNNFNESDLNAAEQVIPGLKTYISSTYTPGAND